MYLPLKVREQLFQVQPYSYHLQLHSNGNHKWFVIIATQICLARILVHSKQLFLFPSMQIHGNYSYSVVLATLEYIYIYIYITYICIYTHTNVSYQNLINHK